MIRALKLAATCSCAVLLSGCAQMAVDELRHSGGYPGSQLDRRFFQASHSKELQLLRASMIVAMASRVGTAYIRDGKEADAFIDYLGAATDEVNYLGGHLYAVDGKEPCKALSSSNCATYSAMFESEIPQLESRMVKVVVAALPQDRAAKFLSSLRSGDVLSAAWSALRLAASAADGAHRGAAVHRSEIEIRALLMQTDPSTPCANNVTAISTVDYATRCIDQPLDRLRADHDRLLPPTVPQSAFAVVFGMIRTSCGMLPIQTDLQADDADGLVEKRTARCRKLAFEPKLRFGGLQPVEAKKDEAVKSTPGTAPKL